MKTMLALREDIFDDYSIETFTTRLTERARIVQQQTVSESGRTLFFYERMQ